MFVLNNSVKKNISIQQVLFFYFSKKKKKQVYKTENIISIC